MTIEPKELSPDDLTAIWKRISATICETHSFGGSGYNSRTEGRISLDDANALRDHIAFLPRPPAEGEVAELLRQVLNPSIHVRVDPQKVASFIRSQARRIEELARLADANVERLKACEHIAVGDEGWEALRQLCPSTAAVSALRDRLADLEKQLAEAIACKS